MIKVELEDEVLDEFYSNERDKQILKDIIEENYEAYYNQSFIFRDKKEQEIFKCKYKGEENELREVNIPEFNGVSLRGDTEQQFVLDDILDDEVRLITVTGYAGTGKTFISLLGALETTRNGIVYTRENIGVGKTLGLLPGELDEKFYPYLAGLWSNIDELNNLTGKFYEEIVKTKPVEYMRGANIRDDFMIIDEAQNASKHILKTLISRACSNCTVILCGDMVQVDDKSLRGANNGFEKVIKAFKGYDLFSDNELTKDKRGRLARLADIFL